MQTVFLSVKVQTVIVSSAQCCEAVRDPGQRPGHGFPVFSKVHLKQIRSGLQCFAGSNHQRPHGAATPEVM